MLRGKFILQISKRKKEGLKSMTQASNLVNKKKKKKDQINPKFSRAENNKGNLKINETENTKKKTDTINELKTGSMKLINL